MLPTKCQPVFSVFVWDNNDIQEETLSGLGTTHCTNGIFVQKRVDSCEPQKLWQSFSSRKRALKYISVDLMPYSSGRSQGSNPIQVNLQSLRENEDDHIGAKMKDFGWFLSRLQVRNSVPRGSRV